MDMFFDTIVSDLDGTLLDAVGKFSPRTFSVLKECIRLGIRVIPNSGRTRASMAPFMKQLQTGQPYIGGNGTEIMDRNGNYISRSLLNVPLLREICKTIEDFGLYAQVYDEDCFYFAESCSSSEEFRLSSKMKAVPVGKLSDFISKPSPKVLAINDPSENAKCKLALEEKFGDQLAFSSSCETYLEIMPAGSSKGIAMMMLMEAEHWNPEHILAFGDGLNDVSMLQAIPHGVAMGNALQEVKAAAWQVCPPNTEDGLACFVEEYVLKPREVSM